MTARERILATLAHERPDRTPTDAWFHQEVKKRLLAHYRTEDWNVVLAELGIEGWGHCNLNVAFPDYAARITPRPGGRPGQKAIWHDERTYADAWGVRHRLGEGDWYEEWVSGPLQDAETAEDVLAYPFPTPAEISEPANYAELVQALKDRGVFVQGGIPNPYKQAWYIRGMDNVLADYLINREVLDAIYDKLYALYTDLVVRMARGRVDMISVTGDIAMQDRIIMGPDTWRTVDKPRLAALIQAARAVNPDVHFFIHSDGNIMDLMDAIVEIGFDVVNPIQPE